MTITARFTLEVKAADRASDVPLTHDLMFVESFIILEILVADLTIVMTLHLVLTQVCLL